ncbi:UNKNOWN [Stylonychia lemnae]|uniref:Uncharacterized protein n=1 Tax=Stylonychia lemnae TaxID=5949 RepID=A0A078ANL8_STYLE|nr:UNKNOWN [Stylonychia lemnae]|eukprot:CDW82563.1 UNKNOWN [Stylonychia lemnae]
MTETKSGVEQPKKKVFWAERILRIREEMFTYVKTRRQQYTTDTKALLCRGIEENEIAKIQNGLKAEQGMFYASRAYVPLALFTLYRRGAFESTFSPGELRKIVKIAIVMQMIDLFGHFLLKQMTEPIHAKYIGINEEAFAYKKKQNFDDYLIQKDYFKAKKENQLYKRG